VAPYVDDRVRPSSSVAFIVHDKQDVPFFWGLFESARSRNFSDTALGRHYTLVSTTVPAGKLHAVLQHGLELVQRRRARFFAASWLGSRRSAVKDCSRSKRNHRRDMEEHFCFAVLGTMCPSNGVFAWRIFLKIWSAATVRVTLCAEQGFTAEPVDRVIGRTGLSFSGIRAGGFGIVRAGVTSDRC